MSEEIGQLLHFVLTQHLGEICALTKDIEIASVRILLTEPPSTSPISIRCFFFFSYSCADRRTAKVLLLAVCAAVGYAANDAPGRAC